MKKSLCVIGSSHVAPLKLAWDKMQVQYPDTEVCFFGANLGILDAVGEYRISGTNLEPDSPKAQRSFARVSGGSSRIDVSRHDAFVLVGLDFNFRYTMEIFRRSRTFPVPKKNEIPLISEDCLKRTLWDIYSGKNGIRLIKALRSVSDRPIFLLADPLPANLSLVGKNFRFLKEMTPKSRQKAFEAFDQVVEKVCEASSVTFLKQSKSTLSPTGFTKNMFAGTVPARSELPEGSKVPGGPINFSNMNTHYGLIILSEVLHKMGCKPSWKFRFSIRKLFKKRAVS